ncbi:hypothetical protein E0K89_021145 [Aquicoccus sp. SCR17]|nr:hypothetical protein [Carideicomes alvinocaridis]
MALFDQHYGAMNPWGEGFFTAPVGSVLSAEEMCPERELLRTEFYADWARPQGEIIRGGGGVIGRSGSTIAVIGANIPLRYGDRLEPRWLEMIELLMPALRQSWTIGQVFVAGALERLLLERSDGPDPALFLLSEAGTISFRNARGEESLLSQEILRCDARGRLHFGDGRAQQLMAHMLRDLRRGPVHGFLQLDHPHRSCRVQMTAFDPDQVPEWELGLFLGIQRPSLLVCLVEEAEAHDPADALMATYGLSTAQAEVALLLAEGLSLREIAERRETAVNTTRNQVRAIAERMGLSRQAEIALAVARHRRPG